MYLKTNLNEGAPKTYTHFISKLTHRFRAHWLLCVPSLSAFIALNYALYVLNYSTTQN